MSSFLELGVNVDVVAHLLEQGVREPFPIQAATIPDALAGHDLCAKAPTGSGKTLSFVLPLIEGVKRSRPRSPQGLILVPTRELASQVQEALQPLAKLRGLRSMAVYGGAPMGAQLKTINRGVDIVVATPGRLQDIVDRRALKLSDVRVVAIDEADRMADMGFMPAVSKLLDETPTDRQTVLYSATLDGAVDKLIKKYQSNPRRHESVSTEEDILASHVFWRVEKSDRLEHCTKVVSIAASSIVFCRTKRGADRLARNLREAGIESGVLHGDRTQGQREKALASFTSGRVNVLIATDVAARGIHVDDVSCVVQFDLPQDEKDYVHRAGRTARAGAEGVVISFVGGADVSNARRIQKRLDVTGPIDRPDIGSLARILPATRVIKLQPANKVHREETRLNRNRSKNPASAAKRRYGSGKPKGPRHQGRGRPTPKARTSHS